MKKLLTTLLILTSLNSFAMQPEKIDYCNNFAELGEVIMQARQNGVPIQELLTKITGDKTSSYILTSAYVYKIYPTDRQRAIVVRDFKELMFLQCIRSI